ncbi:MAG: glycosyltransferase family 39 protein, partial [Myxococcota bacterium]|nr:glycosyltransferase family 39 protein [Myxococcota bacterium]
LESRGPAPWLGALLWAALPWIAMQTRVVKEEAVLVPLAVGMALAFLRWRDDGHRTRDLVLAAVLAGLCPLAKVTGAAFILALMILVASEGKARDFGIALAASLLTACMLFVYGAVIDWDAFLFTQRLQSGRPVHFNIFLRFFDSPLINHSLIGRGWLLFLWLAAMSGLTKRDRRDVAVLAVPLTCYLAAIALGSGTWTFGWYVTPLLPFLCIAAGRFLADLWRAPDLFRGAIFVFVLVFYSLNFVLDPDAAKDPAQWSEIRRIVTVVLALSLAPFALVQAFGPRLFRGWARFAVVVGLATIVGVGGLFVARYDVISAEYRDFDRDRYFDR